MNDIANQEKVAEIKQKFLLELNKYPNGNDFAADIVVQVQGNSIFISSGKFDIDTQVDINVEVDEDTDFLHADLSEYKDSKGFYCLDDITMYPTLEQALNNAALVLVERFLETDDED